jgi:integrase
LILLVGETGFEPATPASRRPGIDLLACPTTSKEIHNIFYIHGIIVHNNPKTAIEDSPYNFRTDFLPVFIPYSSNFQTSSEGTSMGNSIDSKTKRSKLKPRREPYWAKLRPGGAIGHRKPDSGEGTWIGRWRDENGKQHYRSFGHIEDYYQAAKAVTTWLDSCGLGASPKAVTVTSACEAYVKNLRSSGKLAAANDAEGRFKRLVYENNIGNIVLDKLRSNHVRDWLNDQVNVSDAATEEDTRKSKDSANRNLASLKAALNRAFKDNLVTSDVAWRTIGKFQRVSKGRASAYLNMEQRKELLSSCESDLSELVKAVLLTGARPGELAALRVCDFNRHQGTVTFPSGKVGTRSAQLSTGAITFFSELARDRIGSTPLLLRADGKKWGKDSWKEPFRLAARKARLPDNIVMYSLRHTAISEMIMGGMDSFIVSRLTGTSVAMIEKTYGHLKQSFIKEKLDGIQMLGE